MTGWDAIFAMHTALAERLRAPLARWEAAQTQPEQRRPDTPPAAITGLRLPWRMDHPTAASQTATYTSAEQDEVLLSGKAGEASEALGSLTPYAANGDRSSEPTAEQLNYTIAREPISPQTQMTAETLSRIFERDARRY